MAVLFDARERTSRQPLRPGGRLFDFYDTCARLGYDEFRAILNRWCEEMPEVDGASLARQMQTGDNGQFSSGLVELMVHALLKCSGYQLEAHPTLPHTTKKPDFAVKGCDGRLLAYVEVTTNQPPRAEVARTNQEARIHNTIDAARLPNGCRLGYRVEKYGCTSPPLRPLIAEVQRWVRENRGQPRDVHPERVFVAGDWQIELQLFTGFEGAGGGHCI